MNCRGLSHTIIMVGYTTETRFEKGNVASTLAK